MRRSWVHQPIANKSFTKEFFGGCRNGLTCTKPISDYHYSGADMAFREEPGANESPVLVSCGAWTSYTVASFPPCASRPPRIPLVPRGLFFFFRLVCTSVGFSFLQPPIWESNYLEIAFRVMPYFVTMATNKGWFFCGMSILVVDNENCHDATSLPSFLGHIFYLLLLYYLRIGLVDIR